MSFQLVFTKEAEDALAAVKVSDPKRHRKIQKTLGLLEVNPRHPGLHSHRYQGASAPDGRPIFQVYVENNTPAAFRVFFHYGPGQSILTILTITAHP